MDIGIILEPSDFDEMIDAGIMDSMEKLRNLGVSPSERVYWNEDIEDEA